MVMKYFLLICFITINTWAQSDPAISGKKLQKENDRLMKAVEEDDEIDPEKYSQEIKDYHWQNVQTRGKRLLKAEKLSDELKAEQEAFSTAKEPLGALEYQEDEADKLEERVATHIKLLNDKIYHKSKFVFIDWVSWQREANIKSASSKSNLIITNHGFCAGGGWGYKSAFYHIFADGCLMYGFGNVGATVNSVTYKQSNIPTYGAKASAGAGMIVSSLGAEVGLKLPLLYNHVSLDTPDQTTFPGTKVNEESDFYPMISLYSRWPVQKWFVETEFARVIGHDLTYWGLGFGHTF